LQNRLSISVTVISTQINLRRAIVVCALGYFMDVFDLNLFTVLRVSSLTDLGISSETQAAIASHILNAQLLGILSGAFLWGYLGDRYGRLKALYGSIFIYSIATFGCSLLHNSVTYGVLRFLAGFGIAGEVGAATTLIAELMHPQKRGWGIAIIAGIGCLGPAAAVLISWFFDWRATYVVAGVMGLGLLVLRMRLTEPLFFKKINSSGNRQGSLKLLIQPEQALIFISCIFIGAAAIYANWFLNFFSLELSRSVLAEGEIFNQKTSLLIFYIGLGLGDASVCVISQLWRSRRKALTSFLTLGAMTTAIYLVIGPFIKMTAMTLYGIYFIIAFASGIWALFIMIGAEHVGTNIRATTATLISNIARASTIPVLFMFQGLKTIMSITDAAALIGFMLYALAFWGLSRLRETHGLDLDYVETLETTPHARL